MHISDHQYISAPYIYFNNTYDDIAKNLPKTWYVDNDGYDGFVIRADINNSKKKILEDLHKMVEKLPEVDKPKKRSHIYIEYDDAYQNLKVPLWYLYFFLHPYKRRKKLCCKL